MVPGDGGRNRRQRRSPVWICRRRMVGNREGTTARRSPWCSVEHSPAATLTRAERRPRGSGQGRPAYGGGPSEVTVRPNPVTHPNLVLQPLQQLAVFRAAREGNARLPHGFGRIPNHAHKCASGIASRPESPCLLIRSAYHPAHPNGSSNTASRRPPSRERLRMPVLCGEPGPPRHRSGVVLLPPVRRVRPHLVASRAPAEGAATCSSE